MIACMKGALWAKRGERDISRRARHERQVRDEGKRKIKMRASNNSLYLIIVYVQYCFLDNLILQN